MEDRSVYCMRLSLDLQVTRCGCSEEQCTCRQRHRRQIRCWDEPTSFEHQVSESHTTKMHYNARRTSKHVFRRQQQHC